MKPPIVLLTDYGIRDPYAGVLHGVIASRAPLTPVIDLTHGVAPQNIRQASFYLEASFRYFPKGSIFVCVVDPGVGTSRRILCARSKSYYFLAPDNGLLSDVSGSEPLSEIRLLSNPKYALDNVSSTFHGRDLFAPAACALSTSPSCFKTFGPSVNEIKLLRPLPVFKSKTGVSGEVFYFDHFGNAVTNIRRRDIPKALQGRAVVFAGNRSLGRIQKTYGDKKAALPLFNSSERLEIAVPRGNAASFLKIGSKIRVTFEK